MAVKTPIEKYLHVAIDTQAAGYLTQVVVMRCRTGIDGYLYRKFGGGSQPVFNGSLFSGYSLNVGDSYLPNWDNDGWPIDDRDIDVIDISDYVQSFEYNSDISFAASAVNLTVANVDGLFSIDNISFPNPPVPGKLLEATIVSREDSPKNVHANRSVFNVAPAGSYTYHFLPNYMMTPGMGGPIPDPNSYSPLFKENNIIKIREAFPDPDVPGKLIWRDRFTGLISAASASVSGGRPSLNITCHDFMKLATRSTTERVFIPLLATNDAQKNAATGEVLLTGSNVGIHNKIFFDPARTTTGFEDIPYGFRDISFQAVNPEVMSPDGDNRAFTSVNPDWSNVPDPQVILAALKMVGSNNANPNLLADASGTPITLDTQSPVISDGIFVRWFDSFTPAGRPKKVELWNNIYFAQERFSDPDPTLNNNSTHPFLSNYNNWSFVLDTMVDLSDPVTNNVISNKAGGLVMFCLYVEGQAQVQWDGQVVAQTNGFSTLADYATSLNNTNLVQPLPLQPVGSNPAVMQVADAGILCWTADIPKNGVLEKKLYHLQITYQCGSRNGLRNVLALRWYGESDVERNLLMQNAAGLNTVMANPLYRNLEPKMGTIHPYYDSSKIFQDKISFDNFTKPGPNEQDIKKNLTFIAGSSNFSLSVNNTEDTSGYLNIPTYAREYYPFDNETLIVSANNSIFQGNKTTLIKNYAGNDLVIDDPQWFKPSVLSTYTSGSGLIGGGRARNPVMGKPCNRAMFKAFLYIKPDDPDWPFDILYGRGAIQFKQPIPGMGEDIAYTGMKNLDGTEKRARLSTTVKYVFKSQINSKKVDDIISDLMIEDAFGVDRFTNSTSTSSDLKTAPLYSAMRYGWSETVDVNGNVVSVSIPYPGSGYTSSPFSPKVSFAHVQQVPDNIAFTKENCDSTHEAIRKLLDVMQSNYIAVCTPRGAIRGRFVIQSGLPRVIPPTPPAIQPDITNREYFCMTVVGSNTTLDTLVQNRESTFSSEIIMDRVKGFYGTRTLSNNHAYQLAIPFDNPYPNDSKVLSWAYQTINQNKVKVLISPRYVDFQPVRLQISAEDIDSNSITGRDASLRDIIVEYKIYKRVWQNNNWVWHVGHVPVAVDGQGIPTESTTVMPYRKFHGQLLGQSERDIPTYDSYWTIAIDEVEFTLNSISPPPSGIYDPFELQTEPTRLAELSDPTYIPVRPLIVGYDYKLDAVESLALPRDDFDMTTRALIYGEKNSWSLPDLMLLDTTSITLSGQIDRDPITHLPNEGATDLDTSLLPAKYTRTITKNGIRTLPAIQDALTQRVFNTGSKTGFTAGWRFYTQYSDVINSCSTVFIIDEEVEGYRDGQFWGVNVLLGTNPDGSTIGGCHPWPPYGDKSGNGSNSNPFGLAYWYGSYINGYPGYTAEKNNFSGNAKAQPGSWNTGSPSSIFGYNTSATWTDFKNKPKDGFNKDSPPGWPFLTNEAMRVRAKIIPSDNNRQVNEWGWLTAEGKAEGYYEGRSGSPTGVSNLRPIDHNGGIPAKDGGEIPDRMRGGLVQGIKFDWETDVNNKQFDVFPDDENVLQIPGLLPNPDTYFELFTIDFSKEVDIGEIGIAVGYAPYDLDTNAFGIAKIKLQGNYGNWQSKSIRWLAQTNPGIPWNAAGDVSAVNLNIVGLAKPSFDVRDPNTYKDANSNSFKYDPGRWASLSNWYVDSTDTTSAHYPNWLKNNPLTSSFRVVNEFLKITAAAGAAPLAEFYLQMEIGRSVLSNDGTTKIRWQMVVTDQRIQSQQLFQKWDENFFKGMPAKGRFLRLKARRVSPVTYVGFLTRSHCPFPIKRVTANTDAFLNWGFFDSELSFKKSRLAAPIGTDNKIRNGVPYELHITQTIAPVGIIPGKYKFEYNGHLADNSDANGIVWEGDKEIWIDGREAGKIKILLFGGSPLLTTGTAVVEQFYLKRNFEQEGVRNVFSADPRYLGVNILPSIAVEGAPNSNGTHPYDIRLVPWFGALPPVYHSIGFVSMEKLYVFEKKLIKKNHILRPIRADQDPLSNLWYDPKLDRDLVGKNPIKTSHLPKRTLLKPGDVNTSINQPSFNHRTVLKQDASSYTEGRAMTTAFMVLQDLKQSRQGASVNLMYFPDLQAFQTVLVNETAITGFVTKGNGDTVEQFGRTFLIEKLNVRNDGGKTSVSVTLRDYN
jgi:hypothetical protein